MKKSDFEKKFKCPNCNSMVDDKPQYDPKLKRWTCSNCK